MVNMNEVISNIIINVMKQNEKKQVELVGYLGVKCLLIQDYYSPVVARH